MSEFFDRLYKSNNKIILKDELKNEQIPLVMWGAGEVAVYVMDFLKKNNIKLHDVVIDDEYFIDNSYFGCYKIKKWSEVYNKYKKFNVILGHGQYQKGIIIKKNVYINKVFYFISPFYNQKLFNINDILLNIHKYEKAYDIFQDKFSKDIMIAFMNTRLSGNMEEVLELFDYHRTFFKNDIIKLSDKECFWDLGAYKGDTLYSFFNAVDGKFEKILAFEPDPNNYKELCDKVKNLNSDNIEIFDLATWNKNIDLEFTIGKEKLSCIGNKIGLQDESIKVNAVTIDDIVSKRNYKMTLLKINYFPFVLEALEGAVKTIKINKPKIEIMIGFDEKSIYEIVLYLKKLVPEYKFYLRFQDAIVTTLTLFAVK